MTADPRRAREISEQTRAHVFALQRVLDLNDEEMADALQWMARQLNTIAATRTDADRT